MLGGATAVGAEHAGRVRLVDHQHRAAPFTHVDEVRQRGEIAVHAEHGIGDDERPALAFAGEEVVELGGVFVRVDAEGRAREAASVEDARVVQAVAEDRVALAGERRDRADVGHVAGREDDRGLGALESRDGVFEFAVDGHRARDEPRRAAAGAVFIGRRLRRLDQFGMVGEPEIVVRAEADVVGAVHPHVRALGALDGHGPPQQARLRQLVERLPPIRHRFPR